MNISSSSSSSYVTGSSSNKGFSGLVSGMDTESMVEAMLSGTQSKIDKQTGLKQQIEWKQEIYRSIITQINDFQTKFFGTSSTTGLLNQSFYNAMKAVCSSSAFGVTASSSAATGSTKFQVRQLATNSSITSGTGVSGKLEGQLDTVKMQELINKELGGTDPKDQEAAYTVKFQVGSDTVEVNLRDVFVDGNSFKEMSQQKRDAAIEQKLNDAFKDKGVTAKVQDGALTLTTEDSSTSIKVAEGSGELGLARLGLTSASSSVVDSKTEKSTLKGKVSDIGGLEFTVTLDDITKTIKLDWRDVMENGAIEPGKFQTALQTALDDAHGVGQITVVAKDGDFAKNGFELKVSSGRKVMVGGSTEVMESLNWLNGQSNRIGMGGKLSQLYFAEDLQGSEFRFSINGVDFHFTEDSTMSEIVSAINKSGAGVRLVYRTQDDTFTLESTDSGAGRTIKLEQSEGNLLNALFGSGADGKLASGSSASSSTLTLGTITGSPVLSTEEDFKEVKQGIFKLTVNGKEYSLSLPKKSDDTAYTKDEIITELNKQLDQNFGEGNIRIAEDGSSISIEVKNGAVVTVTPNEITDDTPEGPKKQAQGGDLALALFGKEKVSNEVTGDTTLGELGLDGYFNCDATTLGELEEKSGGKVRFENGKLCVTDASIIKNDDAATKKTKELFGVETLQLNKESTGANALEVKGQNAIVEIDGLVTERSSNNFTVNGLNFNLKETTGTYEEIQIYMPASTPLYMPASGKLKQGAVDFDLKQLKDGQYIENGTVYNADGTATDITGLTYEVDGKEVTADSMRVNNGRLEYKPTDGQYIENGTVYNANGTKTDITGLTCELDGKEVTADGLRMNGGKLEIQFQKAYNLTDGQYIENGTVYNADGSKATIKNDDGTEMEITGLTYEKDGQTVTADGLRMNGDKLEIFNGTTETIQVDRDTDQIIEGIKSFVDEYNKLIKTLNDYLDEDTTYKEYAPLTEAQKKEMSEKEIELWEEKAKEGLLHRDSTIDSFLQSMRTALYEKPEGCAYALYDLGIETGEWESKGQLVFTSDSESKLRQILESDPESVMQLFTDSEEGIFTKLNNFMDETAKISSGSPGALVELAGVKGKASESNNTLYEQIKDIDDRIAALKETYEREKNRYWSEFNTMEQLISNMNVQSSWLTQQFSSM